MKYIVDFSQINVTVNEYLRTGDLKVADHLYELVKPLIYLNASTLKADQGNKLFDDMTSAGNWGFLDALTKFRPALGSFVNYCRRRVRGEMLDVLREENNYTRYERAALDKFNKVSEEFYNQHGREPTASELRSLFGNKVGKSTLGKIIAGTFQFLSFINLDDVVFRDDDEGAYVKDAVGDPTAPDTIEVTSAHELSDIFVKELAKLPPRDRRVFESWIYEGKKMKDIAMRERISESRVCQILYKDYFMESNRGYFRRTKEWFGLNGKTLHEIIASRKSKKKRVPHER